MLKHIEMADTNLVFGNEVQCGVVEGSDNDNSDDDILSLKYIISVIIL